uniref:Transmembrane protein 272-like n=1 Tax=Geotrypetes seraphini TaxID=260995 RepID=A0A6P8NTT2_GEOSA|nr:transmembrane protein 272-like [Geotrypetes seraphini]XP_033779777.1 transmembrane protein 272-like [Geotrypetes seraphini]
MAENEACPSSPLLQAMQHQVLPTPLSVGGKILGAALAIANIAVGAVYLGQCPKQKLIPHYLIVSGSGGLLYLALSCLPCGGNGREPLPPSLPTVIVRGLLLFFLFVYFIVGNVWVYSIYLPDFEHQESPKYCQRQLYLYAFWILTLHYILLGALLVVVACLFICLSALRASLPWGSSGSS